MPEADQFDQALEGEFPPGSTFKVITATALIEQGLSPSSPATCPPSLTVDGEEFHNAEGDAPTSTMQGAFAESCNTAFINLATTHLQFGTLPAVAATYGIGARRRWAWPPSEGACRPRGTRPGWLRRPSARRRWSCPRSGWPWSPPLSIPVRCGPPAGRRGARRRRSGSRPSVGRDRRPPADDAEVVTNGTAAGTGLPAGTYAKTGTAEYGAGTPQPTDAWLIGYRGDIAFAMVLQGTGNGGPTDGPIIARFLDSLGAAGLWAPPGRAKASPADVADLAFKMDFTSPRSDRRQQCGRGPRPGVAYGDSAAAHMQASSFRAQAGSEADKPTGLVDDVPPSESPAPWPCSCQAVGGHNRVPTTVTLTWTPSPTGAGPPTDREGIRGRRPCHRGHRTNFIQASIAAACSSGAAIPLPPRYTSDELGLRITSCSGSRIDPLGVTTDGEAGFDSPAGARRICVRRLRPPNPFVVKIRT